MAMQSYSLADLGNQEEEVFDRAAFEPVLLTKESQPSHVIMPFDTYRRLMERLTELEDMALGRAAQEALLQSQMVGSEAFVKALKELANGEA